VHQPDEAPANIAVRGINGDPMPVMPHAHRQLSSHLNIPKLYYDRMLVEQPALLTDNINTWLTADAANKRMVRTLDGNVRAFLSPRYRPLDNFELATAVLPVLQEQQVQVVSSALTETRMYIKAILPSLCDDLPEGLQWGRGHADAGSRICAAITISNSEVGVGTLKVEPSVFTAWCTNLAALTKSTMRKYHVGRTFSAEDSYEVFRDETREADDKAFWMKVKDITTSAFAPEVWAAAIQSIRENGPDPILSDQLPKVVEVTAARFKLTAMQSNSVLTYLAGGGDLTRWGLSSAVTRVANDQDSYEDATALEHIGGEILDLPKSQWSVISEAA
jgi:hypothetical protein